jgi:hypothetical protein
VLGMSNKRVAHELGISPRTVEVHRARIMEKLELSSLSDFVRLMHAVLESSVCECYGVCPRSTYANPPTFPGCLQGS